MLVSSELSCTFQNKAELSRRHLRVFGPKVPKAESNPRHVTQIAFGAGTFSMYLLPRGVYCTLDRSDLPVPTTNLTL
jgi:hypothetical protein